MSARIMIAGTHSGVGKTTVAAAIMAAFHRRGLRVAPFKVGPDYLDPGYHYAACGGLSAPLDPWMLGEDGVRDSFARNSDGWDLSVIEGMMGLYDGADVRSNEGSAAHVAQLLGAPVILVLDASAVARSAGALVLGYRQWDLSVRIVGVIANRVAGEGHARWLQPAIEEAGVPLLGWLPNDDDIRIPERHLGLHAAAPGRRLSELMERLAARAEAHLDLLRIYELASEVEPVGPPAHWPTRPEGDRVRIAVASDRAFCFYYPDNLALLGDAGAEPVPFSPLYQSLPEGVQGLYLGGGYPELHAERLAANEKLKAEIRERAEAGMPVFAECGGFMYLCEALRDAAGVEHRMAGVIPGRTVMETKLQAIGYREVTFTRDLPLGPAGTTARGHEFRYSRYEGPERDAPFRCGEHSLGFVRGNVLASYVHLHLGSRQGLAEAFVRACQEAA